MLGSEGVMVGGRGGLSREMSAVLMEGTARSLFVWKTWGVTELDRDAGIDRVRRVLLLMFLV